MKLKYIFPIFFAAIAFFISCDEEETMTLLDEVQVSSSYVSLPVDGGSATITVTALDSWTAEKVTTDKNKVEWLTISSASGSAGESQLTFSAPSAIDGRTAEVLIKSGGKTQRINIIQGLAQISEASVAEVGNGPDGKTFLVSGVVTSISNTEYGNWDLTDETGTIYIYGTLDKKGGTKNFLSLGIEVGDEVTVSGPKSTYAGSPQLVNVTLVELRKSLVKVDSVENAALPIEGGEFTAYLTSKGDGVSVEIPEDAKSWLSISSIQTEGENTVIKFKAEPNAGGDRGTTIEFSTSSNSKVYTTETSITQKGAILEVSIADFLAAEVGNTQYRLTGVITKIDNDKDGRLYIRDFSGEAYVYKIADYQSKGLKVGDIITVVGKRAAYNGAPQVGGAVLEKTIPVTAATIAEVLAKEDSKEIYYMVTGEITSVDDVVKGNLYLKDGDSEIYVYRCLPGYGATGDARNNLLATKGIKVGDMLTIIANKYSFNGVPQLEYSIYFSHESAE
ncbi:MAG: BACON domain-containing carbohydrate-binding protein [Fermentimonas sp.]|nr:BACON domain-containing carbohydrate-binding protein [Fermentimonas sp.]